MTLSVNTAQGIFLEVAVSHDTRTWAGELASMISEGQGTARYGLFFFFLLAAAEHSRVVPKAKSEANSEIPAWVKCLRNSKETHLLL